MQQDSLKATAAHVATVRTEAGTAAMQRNQSERSDTVTRSTALDR